MLYGCLTFKDTPRSAFKELPRKSIKVLFLHTFYYCQWVCPWHGVGIWRLQLFCSSQEHRYFDSEMSCLQCRKCCESFHENVLADMLCFSLQIHRADHLSWHHGPWRGQTETHRRKNSGILFLKCKELCKIKTKSSGLVSIFGLFFLCVQAMLLQNKNRRCEMTTTLNLFGYQFFLL